MQNDANLPKSTQKKRINAQLKGKTGELGWRDVLIAAGYPAERGQQRAGGDDSPDVKCSSLPYIHWEVKFGNVSLKVRDALMQCSRDCAPNAIAIVAGRKNNSPWIVSMDSVDFFRLLAAVDYTKIPALQEFLNNHPEL